MDEEFSPSSVLISDNESIFDSQAPPPQVQVLHSRNCQKVRLSSNDTNAKGVHDAKGL